MDNYTAIKNDKLLNLLAWKDAHHHKTHQQPILTFFLNDHHIQLHQSTKL